MKFYCEHSYLIFFAPIIYIYKVTFNGLLRGLQFKQTMKDGLNFLLESDTYTTVHNLAAANHEQLMA